MLSQTMWSGTASGSDQRTCDNRGRLETVKHDGVLFASYSYDAGELESKSQNGQTVTYGYDVFSSLSQAVLAAGTTIDYVIDGAQRRIGKKVDGKLTRAWLYQDSLNPIAELSASGVVVSRFVYGTRPNVPDYLIKDGGSYRIIADHLGSPRLVVDASTGIIAKSSVRIMIHTHGFGTFAKPLRGRHQRRARLKQRRFSILAMAV